ncbi:hypothetical protein VKT23_008626 [Stygiomarasmius scandens]|uniref:C2H2-type domain-containing protein n=1 Tax=Marasmiellus scandens TaxID=2682957 RepID=A0ABR1JJR9_9AGAR
MFTNPFSSSKRPTSQDISAENEASTSNVTPRTRPIIPVQVISQQTALPTIPEDHVLRTPFQHIPHPSTSTYHYPTPAPSIVSPVEARPRSISLALSSFLYTPHTPHTLLNCSQQSSSPQSDSDSEVDLRSEQLNALFERYKKLEIRASLFGPSIAQTVALNCPYCHNAVRTGISPPPEWPQHGCLQPHFFNQLLSHIQSCPGALKDDSENGDEWQPIRSSSAPPELGRAASPMLLDLNPEDQFNWCSGVTIAWGSDNIFRTFPWGRLTESGPGSLPVHVEVHDKGRTIKAWSKDCTGGGDPTSCNECKALSEMFQRVKTVTQRGASGSNYVYYNFDKLVELLHERNEQLQAWKLKALNLRRDLVLATRRLDDHERLLEALSERNIPRVHQLLSQARKQGMSVPAMISRLHLACEGLYSAKGFSKDDFDLAIMVIRIGGSHLLKILSSELGLPSLRHLRDNLLFVKVHPNVGQIDKSVVTKNIDDVLIRSRPSTADTSKRPKRGAHIMIDEIALNEQAVYLKHENSIGGLCWVHTFKDDLVLNSFTKVAKIARKVAKGEIHLGKEMTVAVVGIFGETSVYPILVAPTCKREEASHSELTFCVVTEAYLEHPDACHIPLWCWYSDGDPKRRSGGHCYFVSVVLSPDSRLYAELKALLGLNLYTGPMMITIGFDWRHIDKRVSTCTRSNTGMTINNGHCINRIMLLQWLQRIPNMSLCNAQRLLFPRDAQSVPRALELFEAIIQLSTLDITPRNPAEMQDLDAIKMLAEMLSSLRDPFVKVTWTLSQAVVSLSKFAHLLCAQFRANQLQFCSNQLYYDCQSMVKNIIFNIAKQQLLDGTQPFRISEDGDNEEEKYFGILCMLGGHCPGMNFKEGIAQMGNAADVIRIREEHPTWEPRQHRLEVVTAESMDKVNAKTEWKADIIAENCDLEVLWNKGREEAIKSLKASKYPMDATHYNFETLFAKPDTDLMRPFGDGLYPGIGTDDDEDRSLVQEPRPENMVLEPGVDDADGDVDAPVISAAPNERDAIPGSTSMLSEDAGCTEALIDDDSDDHPFNDMLSTHFERQTLGLGHDSRPEGLGIDKDDFLEMSIGDESSEKRRWLHKQTIVSRLITPNYTPKSHDRLYRVRTFTDPNAADPFGLVTTDFTNPDYFYVGDLAITFAKTDECVSLVLVRTTTLTQCGISVNSILIDTLPNADAKVELTGQIYCLHPAVDESSSTAELFWTTSGSYVSINSAIKGTSVTTQKPVKIKFGSHLCELVKPQLLKKAVDGDSLHSTFWRLKDEVLQLLIVSLWSKFSAFPKPLSLMPKLKASSSFPYMKSEGLLYLNYLIRTIFIKDTGNIGLIASDATRLLCQGNTTNVPDTCEYCGEKVDIYWVHISTHILKLHRGVPEPDLIKPVGELEPCAYCGLSGRRECEVFISLTGNTQNRTVHIHSNCPCYSRIQYGSANKGSQSNPCRNVPIVCDLCAHPEPDRPTGQRPAVWRYNMIQHISQNHPEYHTPGVNEASVKLPFDLAKKMTIPVEEEKEMGIPAHHMMGPLLEGLKLELDWIKKAAEAKDRKKGKKRLVEEDGTVEAGSRSGVTSEKRQRVDSNSAETSGSTRGRGRGTRTRGRGQGRGRGN